MAWDPTPFQEHFEELTKQLSRQAFWKTALFGVVLLERQWPSYECLAIGREWGAAKEVRQVLDRLWKGVPTGLRLDDKYLLLLEENPVKPLTEPWDTVAACIVNDSLSLIYTFREKDKKAAGTLAENNFCCLEHFIDACGEKCTPSHPLVVAELVFQQELCTQLCAVPNKEKSFFVDHCRKDDHGSLLGDYWFPNYPNYKPLKRKAKKKTELRYTHLRYDEYVRQMRERDENGRNRWEQEKRKFDLYDRWLNWSSGMSESCNIEDPFLEHVAHRWSMPECFSEIYNYFALSLQLSAKSCWACTEDAEQVRGLFWLSARAQEACYTLLEKKWPCSKFLSYEHSMHKYLPWTAFHAICAGDWDLATHLLKRYHTPLKLRGEGSPWHDIFTTRIWLALLQGNEEEARLLLKQYSEKVQDTILFSLLLDRDKKGLEKYIVREIRAIRKGYENSLETLAPMELAVWKLAHRWGMELDLPPVSEIPAVLLEDIPLDKEKWRLPGQAVLDQALSPTGMELLNQWMRLSTQK